MGYYTRSHEDRWYCRKIGASTTLSIGAASVRVADPLATGLFRLIADVDCFLHQGSSTSNATTTDFFLPAATETYMNVDGVTDTPDVAVLHWPWPGAQNADAFETDDRYVSVIRSSSNGTLWISRISDMDTVWADI